MYLYQKLTKMFSKNKTPEVKYDVHQKELFEHAQARINEKKGLYRHFVFFLAGCILMIVLNLVLNIGGEFSFFGFDWFVIGVLIWSFFLLIHIIRVVFFTKFMGKAWQDKQMKYLVEKQQEKIAKMEQKLDLQVPKEAVDTKNVLLDNPNDKETLL